jgi:hypothetical protein
MGMHLTQRQKRAQRAIWFRERAVNLFEEAYRCGDQAAMTKYLRRARHWSDRYLQLTAHERRQGLL